VRSLRLLAALGLAGRGSAVAAYLLVVHMQGARQDSAIVKHAEEFCRSPHSFVAGNPEGDSAWLPSSTTIA